MIRTAGSSALQGSVSYVPQQAWVMNETLRENILFGKAYDEERYYIVKSEITIISYYIILRNKSN